MFQAFIRRMRALRDWRTHISVRFSIGQQLEIALWEQPGRWLDDVSLMRVVEDLRTVARASQGNNDIPEYGVLLGEREDLADRVITVLYDRKNDRPVGFNALAYLNVHLGDRSETVLHLGLAFVDPTYRQQHLLALLYGVAAVLLLFKKWLRGFWISNVTQVPAVVGVVADNYDDVYPHYTGRTRQTYEHIARARAIMRDHRAVFGVGNDADFDEARQIIINAYTRGSDAMRNTFAEAPKHRRSEVNEFCRQMLDYERGDDVLQIGRCTLSPARRLLRGKLPQGSHVQIAYQALILMVSSIIVPVIRWLVPPETAGAGLAFSSDEQFDPGATRDGS